VVALPTHDQVGNRTLGDRLGALVDDDLLACGAALLLTLPYTPMLFMGEEWGARTPWQFFSSFTDPAVAGSVSAGRRGEFAEHGWASVEVPDPQDPATYERSRLGSPPDDGSFLLEWYRWLLRLRAAETGLGQACAGPGPTAGGLRCDWPPVPAGQRPSWFAVRRPGWLTVAGLADVPTRVEVGAPVVEVVASWRDDATADGDAVVVGPRAAAVVRLAT